MRVNTEGTNSGSFETVARYYSACVRRLLSCDRTSSKAWTRLFMGEVIIDYNANLMEYVILLL